MHFRGKNVEMNLISAEGKSQTLLNVPHYNFAWQTMYYPKDEIPAPKRRILKDARYLYGELIFASLAEPNPASTEVRVLFGFAARARNTVWPT
jgi:hypothetical protein